MYNQKHKTQRRRLRRCPQWGGRPIGSVFCVSDYFISYIYIYENINVNTNTNIYIYIHIRNIHKYSWYKIIRNTEHRPNGAAASRPPHGGVAFGLFYVIDIYGYSLYFPAYIPWIFLIYFLYMFHIFSLGVV